MRIMLIVLIVGIISVLAGASMTEYSQVDDLIAKSLSAGESAKSCRKLCSSVGCETGSACFGREKGACSGNRQQNNSNRFQCDSAGASENDWCQRDDMENCSTPVTCYWTGMSCGARIYGGGTPLQGWTSCSDSSESET